MLQWNGGSRKNVSNSRRSTQKRQKQYFEQRKRQQQNQGVGVESYADGHGGQTREEQHRKEQRSLDVINLRNLSTTAQECKPRTEDLGISPLKMKYCHLGGPSTSVNNKVNNAHSFDIEQTGNLSEFREETVTPNVVSSIADESNYTFKGNDTNEHFHKTADKQHREDRELSIFELLDDDRQTGNSERSHITESHAAFSIEGLGNVGTRTPAQSPPQSGSACFPRRKTSGHLHTPKSFACVLDNLELDMDTSLPSLRDSFCFSSGMEDSKRNWNQNLSTCRDHRQFDVHGSDTNSPFDDSEILYSVRNNNKGTWHGGSRFQDDEYVHEREDGITFKHRYHEIPDYTFKYSDPFMSVRDHTKAADEFNTLGPSSTTSELRKSRKNHEVKTFRDQRHPLGNENFDFRDVSNQPEFSCFANEDAKWTHFGNEDARDNLRFLSVDSSSSTELMGVEMDNSPSKSSVTQSRRHGLAFDTPNTTYGLKNNRTTEFQFDDIDDILQSNKASDSRKYNTTNLPKSKRHHHRNSPFQEKPGSPESWLLGDGYTTDVFNAGFQPFHQSPEIKLTSSRSKRYTEDPFDINAKPSLHRSKHAEATEYSPSHSFIAEKFPYDQTFNPINSHDSPIFSNTGFGLAKSDSSPATGFDGIFRDPSRVVTHKEAPAANLYGQGSVNRDKKPVNSRKSEPEPEKQSNSVSEKEETTDDSNSYSNFLECNIAKDRTLEQKQTLETTASGEASSSSVKITNELCNIDEKEYNHGGGISNISQKGHEVQEKIIQSLISSPIPKL